MTRAMTVAFVVALAVVGAPARAYLPASYGGRLVAPLPDAPVTIDPTTARRASEVQLVSLVFDTLYRVAGAGGRVVEHLIEPDPVVSNGGRTWTLTLRPDVKLHDGRALTAAHVASSLTRCRKSALGFRLAPVTGIRAEGGSAVVVSLSAAAPRLPWLLAAPATAIAVSPKARGALRVGSGPFAVVSRTASAVSLRAHAAYFAGRPFVDTLTLRVFAKPSAQVAAFQVGKSQLSLRGQSLFGGTPRFRAAQLEGRARSTIYLGFGRARAVVGDADFRAGVRHAIDRRRLVRIAGPGPVQVAHRPVASRRVRKRRDPFDRARARRALARAAARHAELRNPTRARLTLLVDASRPVDELVAGQLVADLDRVGISMRTDGQPAAEYARRLARGQFDLVVGRVVPQIGHRAAPARLADLLAAAGLVKDARRCIAAGRCSTAARRRLAQQLPLIALVHVGMRLHHDARLGGVRIRDAGRIDYADVFWRRRK